MDTNSQPVVLVTGGTGFVGSHLVEALLETGEVEVHTTAYNSIDNYVKKILPYNQVHQLNLLDQDATFRLIEQLQPDYIYHLAALAAVGKSFANIKKVLDNNTQLQLNLLEAVRQYAPRAKMLVIGSAMEYDLANAYPDHQPTAVTETYPLGPASPYAVSKVMQDLLAGSYAQSFKLNIIRVRSFNHIGERQSPDFAIPAFAQQIVAIENQEQEMLRVGNLESIRDFTDVKDTVKAYILLMERGQVGQVYNVGSGVGVSMQQILDQLIELSSAKIKIEIDESKIRPIDIPVAVADPSRINALGWQPQIELRDTLQRILKHWRTHP